MCFYTFTDTHSLKYFVTVVSPGISCPEFSALGLVDGQLIGYYDSDIGEIIPKTEWMQKMKAEVPEYWKTQKEIALYGQEGFRVGLRIANQYFNQTTGKYTNTVSLSKLISPDQCKDREVNLLSLI